MIDKSTLRPELRARRAAYAVGRPPLPVPERWRRLLQPGITVASYVPLAGEADPALLAAAATAAGARLALPHVVDRATPLRFLSWETEAALAAGPFGLSQPAADVAELTPDIILAPLLGFDARLNRIGNGASHYDRAFAAHRDAVRVGVAWSVQQVDALPLDPWDVPLHGVITEHGWLSP